MLADAQRDDRPAEYIGEVAPTAEGRKVWLTPTTRVPRSNASNIGERKTWTQSEYCTL